MRKKFKVNAEPYLLAFLSYHYYSIILFNHPQPLLIYFSLQVLLSTYTFLLGLSHLHYPKPVSSDSYSHHSGRVKACLRLDQHLGPMLLSKLQSCSFEFYLQPYFCGENNSYKENIRVAIFSDLQSYMNAIRI